MEEVGREGSHPGTNRQKVWRLSVSPGPRPGPFPEAARPARTGAVALARNLLPTSSPQPGACQSPAPVRGLGGGPAARHQQSIPSGGGAARLRGTDTLAEHSGGGTSGRMAEASERLYRVEYAKSGRASCKKCSESIPKDSLRMAIMVQVRRGRAGGAGRRCRGGCLGSGPPRSPCGSR